MTALRPMLAVPTVIAPYPKAVIQRQIAGDCLSGDQLETPLLPSLKMLQRADQSAESGRSQIPHIFCSLGWQELNLGRVDKRDSQTRLVLIQDCFLRSSHGSRGIVGCGVGFDWAAAAA